MSLDTPPNRKTKDYRCEKCGKTYSRYEYDLLPAKNGYPICTRCNHWFGNPWYLASYAEIEKDKRARILTRYTIANYGTDENPQWYQTRIAGKYISHTRWKYQTKRQAIDGHRRIRNLLQQGHYTLEKNPLGKPIITVIENPDISKTDLLLQELDTPTNREDPK